MLKQLGWRGALALVLMGAGLMAWGGYRATAQDYTPNSTPVAPALDQYGCLRCHGRPEVTTERNGQVISTYVDEAVLNTSAHKFTDCTQCHTTEPHKIVTPLTKLSLADACGVCHIYQRDQHKKSIHGQFLALGNRDVATCVDCHSLTGPPHGIDRVLSHESPAYRKNIAGTCGRLETRGSKPGRCRG